MNKRSRPGLAILVVLAGIVLFFALRYSGKAPLKLAASDCDAALWNHVYEKDRQQVIEPCTAVEGRVIALHRSGDGDLHITLDPDNPAILNFFNVAHGDRKLAVEIVCEHTPTRPAAIPACADFTSQVMVPEVGNRVRVTGAYVTDRDIHWREIHPVTRIEVLR